MALSGQKDIINTIYSLPFFIVDKKGKLVFVSDGLKDCRQLDETQLADKDIYGFAEILLKKSKAVLYDKIKRLLEENYCISDFPVANIRLQSFSSRDDSFILIAVLKMDAISSNQEFLNLLNDIILGIADIENPDELLKRVVNKLYDSIFSFCQVSIFLVDDTKEYFYLAVMEGDFAEMYEKLYPDGYFQSVDQGVLGRAFQTKQMQIIKNVGEDPDYHQVVKSGVVSEICIPIIFRHEVIGVVNIETKEQYIPGELEIKILESISLYLSQIIGNRMLMYEIAREQEDKEKYIMEIQEAKERLENQAFGIIESMEQIEEAKKIIEKQNMIMYDELNIAGNLQKKLLPEISDIPNLVFNVWFEPSASLGGDFYDMRFLDNGNLLFIQVDVTGHGVSSALLAAMSKIAFQNAGKKFISPAKILEDMNVEFRNLNETDLFFSAFVGLLDLHNEKLIYSNAAHPFPLLFKEDKIIELDTDGFLVGVMPEMQFGEQEIQFSKNDLLLVYTDGLIEARNSEDKMFGMEGVKSFIKEYKPACSDLHNGNMLEKLVQKAKDFSGDTIDDDITILCFKYK